MPAGKLLKLMMIQHENTKKKKKKEKEKKEYLRQINNLK